MSDDIEIILANLLDEANGERLTLPRLNQLVRSIAVRVTEDAVTNSIIADGSISRDQLDEDISASIGIQDGSVTTAKLSDAAVLNDKFGDDAVAPGKLTDACLGGGFKRGTGGGFDFWVDGVGLELVTSGSGKKVALKDGGVPLSKLASAITSQQLQEIKTDFYDSLSLLPLVWTTVPTLSNKITPVSASNKILVSVTLAISMVTHSANERIGIRVLRDGSPIGVGDAAGNRTPCGSFITSRNTSWGYTAPFMFLDDPATTSEVTYTVQFFPAVYGRILINQDYFGTAGTFGGISTITLQEV